VVDPTLDCQHSLYSVPTLSCHRKVGWQWPLGVTMATLVNFFWPPQNSKFLSLQWLFWNFGFFGGKISQLGKFCQRKRTWQPFCAELWLFQDGCLHVLNFLCDCWPETSGKNTTICCDYSCQNMLVRFIIEQSKPALFKYSIIQLRKDIRGVAIVTPWSTDTCGVTMATPLGWLWPLDFH